MKIYVVVSNTYCETNIEEVFVDKSKAEMFCAENNGEERFSHSDFIVQELDTQDDCVEQTIKSKIGYVYSVYKLSDGSYDAHLESIMYKSVFDDMNSRMRFVSFVWVEEQSEKLAIETYLRELGCC